MSIEQLPSFARLSGYGGDVAHHSLLLFSEFKEIGRWRQTATCFVKTTFRRHPKIFLVRARKKMSRKHPVLLKSLSPSAFNDYWNDKILTEQKFHPFSPLCNPPRYESIPQSSYTASFSCSNVNKYESRKRYANAIPAAGVTSFQPRFDHLSENNRFIANWNSQEIARQKCASRL